MRDVNSASSNISLDKPGCLCERTYMLLAFIRQYEMNLVYLKCKPCFLIVQQHVIHSSCPYTLTEKTYILIINVSRYNCH